MVKSNEAAVLANPITALKANLVDVGVDRRLPGRISVDQRLERGGGCEGARPEERARHKADERLPQALPDGFVVYEEETAVQPPVRPDYRRTDLRKGMVEGRTEIAHDHVVP